MIQFICNLFKPAPVFSDHKIELHRKYGGTFMFFSYHIKEDRWLLRRQTANLIDAMNLGVEFSCPCPMLDEYTECDWCCHSLGVLIAHD